MIVTLLRTVKIKFRLPIFPRLSGVGDMHDEFHILQELPAFGVGGQG